MLHATLQAVRSILTADPSVNPPERNRLLSLMSQGPEAQANPTVTAPIFTVIIRRELAPIVKAMNNISENVRAFGQRAIVLTRQLKDIAPLRINTNRNQNISRHLHRSRQAHIRAYSITVLRSDYRSRTGTHRFFFAFATRPQLLQMNMGLFTSGIIFLMFKVHGQHARTHILFAPQQPLVVFLLIFSSLF